MVYGVDGDHRGAGGERGDHEGDRQAGEAEKGAQKMRELKPNPCLNCTDKRFIGCHGKNEDGTWRCKDYGEAYEKADADYKAYQNSQEAIMDRYVKGEREKVRAQKIKSAGKKHILVAINKRRS